MPSRWCMACVCACVYARFACACAYMCLRIVLLHSLVSPLHLVCVVSLSIGPGVFGVGRRGAATFIRSACVARMAQSQAEGSNAPGGLCQGSRQAVHRSASCECAQVVCRHALVRAHVRGLGAQAGSAYTQLAALYCLASLFGPRRGGTVCKWCVSALLPMPLCSWWRSDRPHSRPFVHSQLHRCTRRRCADHRSASSVFGMVGGVWPPLMVAVRCYALAVAGVGELGMAPLVTVP